MATLVEIPFTGGVREDIEAKIMPNGVLTVVKNLRLRKDGSWVKRNAYTNVTLEDFTTDAAIKTSDFLAVGERYNDRLLVTQSPAELWLHDPEHDQLTRPTDATAFVTPTLPLSTFSAPQKQQVVASLDENIIRTDVASFNGYTAVVYQGGTTFHTGVRVRVFAEDTGALMFEQLLSSTNSPQRPQVVRVGFDLVAVWMEDTGSSAIRLSFSVLDTNSSADVVAFTTASVLTTNVYDHTDGLASGFSVKMLEDSSSTMLVVYQFDADEVEVDVRSGANYATSSTLRFTSPVSGQLWADVWGNAVDDNMWVAWHAQTSGGIYVAACDADLSDPTSVTAVETEINNIGRPSLIGYTATSAALAWSSYNATPQEGEISYCTVSATAVAGSIQHRYGLILVSHLFALPEGENYTATAGQRIPFGVCQADSITAGSGSDENSRNFYIIMLDPSTFELESRVAHVQGTLGGDLAPLISSYTSSMHVGYNSGTFYFAGPVITRGLANDATPAMGINLWRWSSTSWDRAQPTRFGPNVYFTGAVVYKWDGRRTNLAGFLRAPDIISATAGSTGALTPGLTYRYQVVYERIDADGFVLRSAPSLVATITLAPGEDSVALVIRDLKVRNIVPADEVARVHVYRTLGNESTYHRVTPETGLPRSAGALASSGTIDYTDIASDLTAEEGAILYTDGGVLPTRAPPPCKYLWVAGQRLWAAGLEDPEIAECSDRYTHDSEVNFPGDSNFRVNAKAPIVGGGTLESNPVIFTERQIFAVVGPGPDELGSGQFDVVEIPCDAGLVEWGHRSIIETPVGLIYQSAPNRIDLLPRGFGQPVWIGQPVRETLEEFPYITSAVLVEADKTVRFTCVNALDGSGDGALLVWDMRGKVWSVDYAVGTTRFMVGGKWGDSHVLGREASNDTDALAVEGDAWPTADHLQSEIVTGDIRNGALHRWGRVRCVNLLLEYRAPCIIEMQMSVDSGLSWVSAGDIQLDASGYTIGSPVTLRWHLPIQKSDRFRFKFLDKESSGGVGTEGVRYLGMSLEMRPKQGARKVRAAQRY